MYKPTVPLLSSSGFGNSLGSGINRLGEAFKLPAFKVFSGDEKRGVQPWWKRTLDPSSEEVLVWNRIFLMACLVALFVDPLFFYLPQVDVEDRTLCVTRNIPLGVPVTLLRTLADFFYILHVVIRFRTAFVAPSSRIFGRGELVTDRKEISRRYIRSGFAIDLLAALPLPQFVIWCIIPVIELSQSRSTYNALQLIVLIQYVLRVYLIFPLNAEIVKAAGVVTKTAWAGAAYNLLLYMLASHVLGAAWYLLSVERFSSCWKKECRLETSPIACERSFLDCNMLSNATRKSWANSTQVFVKCDPNIPGTNFDYGMFENAILKKVVSNNIVDKYFYCLWWGLQQLRYVARPKEITSYVSPSAHWYVTLHQTYLQSITSRLEEWRLRRRDTEEWMKHRQLPEDLQGRVRRFVQYKWLATRGVDEEAILSSLPTDLRREIQIHLCLGLVSRVPLFAQMDNQLRVAICERLSSYLSTTGTSIVREGDPVTEMLFIIRGKLKSSTTDGGRSGFFNSISLGPGDFCGEELLAWALLPNAANLPCSTRTVETEDEVEAFALPAEELKFVANQFRLLHSKKLQHTFRYYSHQWRTWGACFLSAAWRRFKKRKMAQSLSLKESFSDPDSLTHYVNTDSQTNQVASDDNVQQPASSQVAPNLGVTLLAKRFAMNTRKGAQRSRDVDLPKMMKPQDPDFFGKPTD
ncbi:hypothetical protein KSS87_001709 [Heliosperma pusillum]|nr:hypothetical protein KSS87_001709 [Heliosperma pusillum]